MEWIWSLPSVRPHLKKREVRNVWILVFQNEHHSHLVVVKCCFVSCTLNQSMRIKFWLIFSFSFTSNICECWRTLSPFYSVGQFLGIAAGNDLMECRLPLLISESLQRVLGQIKNVHSSSTFWWSKTGAPLPLLFIRRGCNLTSTLCVSSASFKHWTKTCYCGDVTQNRLLY